MQRDSHYSFIKIMETSFITRKMEHPPKRPLSAYNFFFKSERSKLLGVSPEEEAKLRNGKSRPHRKTPGMIGFGGLARHVGEKWKRLSDQERVPYFEAFEKDKSRYQDERKQWEHRLQSKRTIIIHSEETHQFKVKRSRTHTIIGGRSSENVNNDGTSFDSYSSRLDPYSLVNNLKIVQRNESDARISSKKQMYEKFLNENLSMEQSLFDEGPTPIEKMITNLSQLEHDLRKLVDSDLLLRMYTLDP